MQNKIIQGILVVVILSVALVFSINTLDLDPKYQIGILSSIIIAAFILIIFRKLPFDFKFLNLTLLGYALGGRGFAYVTPFEPVYIGEIALLICLIGYFIRWPGKEIFKSHLHIFTAMWMAAVGIYLFFSFPEYKMLAIRDSAIGYYAIFFFFAFNIFKKENNTETFKKVLKACIVLGYISCFFVVSGIFDKYFAQISYIRYIFYPHPDAFIPLIAGGAVYGTIQGIQKRNIFLIIFGFIGIILLLMTKTAGIFCLGCTMLLLLVFTKRFELAFVGFFAALMLAIVIGFIAVYDSYFFENTIMRSDQVQTLVDVGNASSRGNASTTDWRVTWWTVIANDTMQSNPMFGSGMGSDLTTHFLLELFGPQAMEDANTYARYPHCIIFNVFGRMGFVGLAVFLVMFLSFIRFSIQFTKKRLSMRIIDSGDLIALSVFFSGLMNSLVQATYEVPHGAILNWVCLAYLGAEYYRPKNNEISSDATAYK